MHIVTRKHLINAEERFPDAAKEIQAWFKVASAAHWRSFVEVRKTFGDADSVDGRVIFNIRRNRYRLITIIHYSREKQRRITEGNIYIRPFLTHKQYDNKANWDKGVKR